MLSKELGNAKNWFPSTRCVWLRRCCLNSLLVSIMQRPMLAPPSSRSQSCHSPQGNRNSTGVSSRQSPHLRRTFVPIGSSLRLFQPWKALPWQIYSKPVNIRSARLKISFKTPLQSDKSSCHPVTTSKLIAIKIRSKCDYAPISRTGSKSFVIKHSIRIEKISYFTL